MLWMNEPRHPETSKANIPVTQSIHDLWHLRWPISAEPRCSHFGERRARGRGTPRDAGGDAISGHRHQRHPACHMSWKIRNFWKQQLTTTIYPIMNEICIYIYLEPPTTTNFCLETSLPRLQKYASFAKKCSFMFCHVSSHPPQQPTTCTITLCPGPCTQSSAG